MDELEEQRLAIIRPFLLPVDEHGNPRSAIEAARQFGVDIEHLRHNRQRSPIQRLRIMQSMAQFIFVARASIQRQKEKARYERLKAKEAAGRSKELVHLITLRALKEMEDKEADAEE